MILDRLKDHSIILASGSPRRQQFLKELKIAFEIRLKPIEEVYPNHLKGSEITDYLAQLKATPYKDDLKPNDILITSDTIVWHRNRALGKPIDALDALGMLKKLSNDWHEVITSVCFTTQNQQKTVTCSTKVRFKELTDAEINYYIEQYTPFDKAGAYGIQEWIGLIGIEEIQGSYPNVVGLPTYLVYKTLLSLIS